VKNESLAENIAG